MEQWDYLVVIMSFDADTQGWVIHEGEKPASVVASQGDALKIVGDEGWELVSVVLQEWEPTTEVGTAHRAPASGGGSAGTYRAYFKRRKP